MGSRKTVEHRMSGTRALQKEKTRQAIIDAALNQLSAEQGFSNLSL